MFRCVHKELKYTADVPPGRSVGFYSDEACTTLLDLVDAAGDALDNPVEMVQGATVEVFTETPVVQAWAKSDYLGDVARPVSFVPDLTGTTDGSALKVALANGTAAATDVTVSGMAVGDVLVAVLSFTTAAAIASVANRTAEYAIGAGKLVKAAGTNETNNQLLILYWDLTA